MKKIGLLLILSLLVIAGCKKAQAPASVESAAAPYENVNAVDNNSSQASVNTTDNSSQSSVVSSTVTVSSQPATNNVQAQ